MKRICAICAVVALLGVAMSGIAMGASQTITNHLTVNPYLTLSVGKADLYYEVTHLTDVASDSTSVGIQTNMNWARSVHWSDLTGSATHATIAAANLSGASDLNGALTAAGPNTHTGAPTATYLENLAFSYTNSINAQADSYTGTITVDAATTP